jgi:hypothetical protein
MTRGVTFQKTPFFVVTAVETSNLAGLYLAGRPERNYNKFSPG